MELILVKQKIPNDELPEFYKNQSEYQQKLQDKHLIQNETLWRCPNCNALNLAVEIWGSICEFCKEDHLSDYEKYDLLPNVK